MRKKYHKVGIANDVEARLAQLQTGSPLDLSIEECYSFDNAEIAEKAIHQAWKKERVRGEWFELLGDGVNRFQTICSLLGGQVFVPESYDANDEAVEVAEEMSEPVGDIKFDYSAMFAVGRRMAEQGRDSKYWNWRRGSVNRETIYGGRITDLPYPIEEMRRIYRDGEPVIPATLEER